MSLLKKKRARWLMILPCVLIIISVVIFPLVYSLVLSFHEWIIPKSPDWMFNSGFNYVKALYDERFLHSLYVTVIIGGSSVVLEFVFGLSLALLMNREIRGKRYIVSILTTPMMIVPVIAGFMWRTLWLGDISPINYNINALFGFILPWLEVPALSQVAVIIANVWEWTPFMFLILLAGLASIPIELYESAQIDGASSWQIFRNISMPIAKPLIILAVLIRSMEEVKIFDMIFYITFGGPGIATESVTLYIYRVAFGWFNMGYGAAISFILLIIVSIIVMLFIRVLPKR